MKKDRFGTVQKKKTSTWLPLLSVMFFLLVLAVFINGLETFSTQEHAYAIEATHRAIHRAAVQFYAIEGHFPPSLGELERRFGLQIDHQRFLVHYSAFAANVMPTVTIIPRN